VNAETEKDRDKLLKRFEQWVDLSANKGKLHHYFSKSKTNNNATTTNNNSDDTIICLSSDDEGDVEIIDPSIRAALPNVKIDVRTQQRELERLASSKNEKKRSKREEEEKKEKEHIIIDLSKESNSPMKGINHHSNSREVLEPFPLGCVCVVRNGEFKQFKNRKHVEQRLRELSAEVVNRKSSRVTHIMCAHGSMQATELLRLEKMNTTSANAPSAVAAVAAAAATASKTSKKGKKKSEDDEEEDEEEEEEYPDDAITVTESWLMRHVRAMRNGTAREHTSEEIKHFQERQRKRLKLAQEEKKKKKKQKKQKEKSEEEKCTTVE
jgi:ribosomal protein L12E/L44/L45/RPP1/RPP2